MTKFAAQHEPHTTVVADTISLPHPSSRFDFAISIAVIHHLSTTERRVAAIQAILQTLRPPVNKEDENAGQALFFVWALEQKSSRRGWDKGDEQDQMVPWVLRNTKDTDVEVQPPQTYHRYYHLFKEGELEENIRAAGGEIVRCGYDRDNWWSVAKRTVS